MKIFILAVAAICAFCRADTLILNDGRTLEGTVTTVTKDAVAIKTATGFEVVKMADVKSMKRDVASALAETVKANPVLCARE